MLNDVTAVEQLKPGTLVRFRCMVQNMYDPEMYLAEYDHVNTATGERTRMHAYYSDVTQDAPHGFAVDASDAVAKISDRTPMHCMGIPHETQWVSECCKSAAVGFEGSASTRLGSISQENVKVLAVRGPLPDPCDLCPLLVRPPGPSCPGLGAPI